MTAAASVILNATQAEALLQGFTVLVQRLDELAGQSAFTTEIAGLGQPLATLHDLGQQLHDGLAQPLAGVAVGASTTVASIKGLMQSAVDAAGGVDITAITESLETLPDRQILWLDIDLSARRTLSDYTLDLGQAPSGDPAAPSLLDQGLRVGQVQVDLEAGLEGRLRIGVDLRPGLAMDQAVVLRIDALQACAHASAVVEDVELAFGILDLGPRDAQVSLDSCVAIDLLEGASGRLSLGTLATGALSDLFQLSWPGASDGTDDLSIAFDIDFDVGGFTQSGQTLSLGLRAPHGFDLDTLVVDVPALNLSGSGLAFDFGQFAGLSVNDLGQYLNALGQWLPQLGQGFELPVLDQDFGDLFDLGADFEDWLASLRDAQGQWDFDGIFGLIDRLGGLAGLEPAEIAAAFDLQWNASAQALQWTIPYQLSLDQSFSADAGALAPEALGLAGSAQARVQAALDIELTGGVALHDSAQADPVTTATLLSSLNSGLGLTSRGLLTGSTAQDDIRFVLSDGTVVGVDLNPIAGLGSAGSAGTATVADLLSRLNAASPGKLAASLGPASQLMLRDLTHTGTGTPAFRVEAPTLNVTLDTRADGSAISTTSTSVAPLVLGLWGAQGQLNASGQLWIEGASLASVSPLDRLYLNEQSASDPLLRATVTLDVQVEGGASLGPVSLQVVEGELAGQAQWQVELQDPGTGADDDGRIYLSELLASGAQVLSHTVTAPSLEGVLQLKVTPEALNASLDIDAADYSTDPLDRQAGNPDGRPDTALVPYLDLALGSGGWDLTVTPSEKLASLLDGQWQGLSWHDLPQMLDMLVLSLEETPLWQLPIPMTDLSLGDLLDFGGRVARFELPDLPTLLGDLTGTASGAPGLGDWKLDLDADLRLALGELRSLDASWPDLNLGLRLETLQEELGDLLLSWQGRDLGDLDFEADFLSRLGAWQGRLSLALGDLDATLDLAFGAKPVPTELSALQVSLGGLLGFLDGLDFGLAGLAGLIEGVFMEGATPRVPGLSLSVDLPQLVLAGDGSELLFDLDFSLDPALWRQTLALQGLDVQGSVLQIDGDGQITATLGGSLHAQIGFDLDSLRPLFNADETRANLTLGIESAPSTVLSASLGGLATVSLGSVTPADPIVVALTASASSSAPATLSYADGALSASAHFRAALPLYVDLLSGGLSDVGTVTVTASAVAGSGTPSFSASASFDGDLSELFTLGELGLDGWLGGAIAFIDALTVLLESDLAAGLPYLPAVDLSDDGFLADLREVLVTLQTAGATQLGQVQAALQSAIGQASKALDGTVVFYVDGTALDGTSPYWTQTMGELFAPGQGIENFVVDLGLSGWLEKTLDFGSLDLGLGDLAVGGSGGLDLAAGFGLNLGLGYTPSDGFFVQGTQRSDAAGQELTLDLALGLNPASAVELALGPLRFEVQDATPGDLIDDVDSRELSATLALDLGSGVLGSRPGPLLQDLSLSGSVKAQLDLSLSSNVGLGMDLRTGFHEADGSPITLNWTPGDGLDFGDPARHLHFELPGVYIDFDALFGPAISTMAERLNDVLDPLAPVLDMLTDEVPLVSDLSRKLGEGKVTYLDAIGWFGDGLDSATEFIATVNTLADLSSELATSGRFYLGGLGLEPPAASARSAAASAGPSLDDLGYRADAGGQADAVAPGDRSALLANDWGLYFPLLDDPGAQLMNFLFGDQADLITWDVPDLQAGFELRQSFPLFPPLFVELFGGVSFATNFDLGYDTRGLRLAMDSGRAGDLVKGVYLLDDHRSIPGADQGAELTLEAAIGAGAKLNVVVAQAGVEGGLRGTLSADLADPNGDGKVYVDELTSQLSGGLACVFDLSGALDVFLSAYIKVGVDTPFGFVTLYKDRFKLAEATLLDWSDHLCEPVVPDVASASGGTLTLHMGSLATRVIPGQTEDGDEVFLIDQVGGKTVVTAYGHSEEFSGITQIVFDAGEGHDTVLIAPGVTAAVQGRGGAGNDNLVGGSGVNRLQGDEGSDMLSGRAAADSLVGGDGDDFIYGYGGADTLDGGSGDDALFGEDDLGDLAAFKADNPDFNAGSAGDDRIDGGLGEDLVIAGDGRDSVYGGWDADAIDAGAGDDWVEGGDGSDQIRGGAGNDRLFGDNANGRTSAAQTHADKIEGDAGYNQIWGGAGNDLLYAADEDQLADAPAVAGSGLSSRIDGGDGADMIYGTAGKDSLYGGFESDYIDAGRGDDLLLGGPGGDALRASGGASTLLGGHGNDVIDGGDGANWIEGGPGDDQVYARGGADTVHGGTTDTPAKGGYAFLQLDLASGRVVLDAEHGGFRSTAQADGCGPEIYFHPEVYAPTAALTVQIFEDADRDGVRDPGEAGVSGTSAWLLTLRQAPDGHVIWDGAITGAQAVFQVPDGLYDISLMPGPGNTYSASTAASISTLVDMRAGVASPAPQMGWYSGSDIIGRVTTYDTQTKDRGVAAGAVVFIDSDQDGRWDSGERFTLTAADGSYVLRDLSAGSYTLAVTDDGLCALSQPRSAQVSVNGVADMAQHFELILHTAPVVSQVQLYGGPSGAGRWWNVPGGNEQLLAMDPGGGTSRIAIDLCSRIGVMDGEVNAQLLHVDTGYKMTLKVLAHSLNRVEFGPADGSQLQFGRYQLSVDASSLQDLQKNTLDGEWSRPQDYASGNGSAGGNFVFDFVLGTAATTTTTTTTTTTATATASSTAGAMATGALPSGTLSVGTGTATVQGSVWAHDARLANLARDGTEVGIAGQTIELRDGSGALVARLNTGLDLDGNGQLSAEEAGLFRITDLRAGNYTVTQLPSGAWAQAVSSAAAPDLLLTAAAGSSGDTRLALVEGSAGSARVTADWQLSGFRARDIAFKDTDEAYAIGKTADNQAKLIHVSLGSTAKVTDLATLPSAFKGTVVGLDLVSDQYLLAAASDGTVLRYNLAAGQWLELGRLSDASNRATLYPVGDIAVASPEKAWAVVSGTAPVGDIALDNGKQMLLQFDPRTLQMQSLVTLSTASPIVGLDLGSNGRLTGLDTQGRLYDIQPATGVASSAMTVTGQGAATIGGLSLLAQGQLGKSGGTPISVNAQDGKTTDIGFGNLPNAELLADGHDTIDGGCGPEGDLLYGDDGVLPPQVRSEGGHDWMRGRGGNDTLIGGLQGDALLGDAGQDSLVGGSSEGNRIEGGEGKDTLIGGSAADLLAGGADADSLLGGAGNDWLHGQGGDDSLQGQDGHDLLVGGAGNDQLAGGNGNDTLVVVNTSLGGDYAAAPEASGGGSYDGGAGSDKLVVVMEGASGAVDLLLDSTRVLIAGLAPEAATGLESALLVGTDHADQLMAAAFGGSSAIYGLAGNDSLTGGAGNDTLAGGSGRNTLTGGALDDLYLIDAKTTGDRIVEAPSGGNDTVDASTATDAITAVVSSAGTTAGGGAVFEFSNQVERLLLGAGSDTLELSAGLSSAMSVAGGAGSDTLSYAGWSATSPVNVNLGNGTATGLGAAQDFDNAWGGAGNDTLVGSATANTLDGGAGQDSLVGGAGNDLLRGQAGNDSLLGEAGQDTLSGGDGSNTLEGGADNDLYLLLNQLLTDVLRESAGGGSDTLNFSGLAGTDIVHTIGTTDVLQVSVGTAGGAVQAQSKLALESVIGGQGADRFVFQKAGSTPAVLDGGASLGAAPNVLDYSAYVTPVNVALPAKPALTGTATGTGGIKNIDQVIGGSVSDVLRAGHAASALDGGPGNDSLIGSDLDDLLTGGAGADSLVGGEGRDTALFSGPRSNYSIDGSGGLQRLLVSSVAEGSDTLSGIETLRFADGSWSASSFLPGTGSELTVSINTWNGRAIPGVTLTTGSSTNAAGQAQLPRPDSALALTPKRTLASSDRAEVGLSDAIAVLKNIVGLAAFGPHQAMAADFSSDGAVDLNDAIGILKHVVGLSAPAPAWRFVDASSSTPQLSDPIVLRDVNVQLVGILLGDADGSWTP